MTEPTAGQLHARKVADAVQSGEDPRSVTTDDPVGDKTLAYWTCEVGPAVRALLPDGADFPMRQGVRAAFRSLAGFEPARLSSGWGRQASPKIDVERLIEMGEVAWGIIANAGGGDWTKESPDWQAAAARWRDEYMPAISAALASRDQGTGG